MSHAQNITSSSESDPFGLQKRSVITIYRWSPFECCWSVEVASRAYWKGYLKLSLVSCPIALSPATSDTARVSFRQINKKTGNRLRYQHVDDVTREPFRTVVTAQSKGPLRTRRTRWHCRRLDVLAQVDKNRACRA
jgi:hypothetical protein